MQLRILHIASVCFFGILGGTPQCHAQEWKTESVAGIDFELREGMQLQDATTGDLTHWPVVADWDRHGRLVVVESGGVAKPIVEHNKKLLHRIVRLEDSDADGVFDRRILAADKLPLTQGVLCLENYILASAPPHIWKLTDADGDGYCEKREVWFDGQTITHCANDLHGPYLGVDGWVYWCKGAFAEQTHVLADGSKFQDRASHIFRRRIEGGPIEPVISGGMDNPVEVAFAPSGELFFTSTFLQNPADGKRDGIAHAVYGGAFGKVHRVVEEVVRTGPLMPIMTHLGPAAPSGLLTLSRDAKLLPTGLWQLPEPSDSPVLVAAQFNLHQISAHRLVRDGATFSTQDEILLRSERVDFHPTDVLQAPDGSLLVVDTGGWYDLCCPTSRIDQKIAGGGIYRLSNTNRERYSKLPLVNSKGSEAEQVVELAFDRRPWVAREALLKARSLGSVILPILERRLQGTRDKNSKLRILQVYAFVAREESFEKLKGVFEAFILRGKESSSEDLSSALYAAHVLSLYRRNLGQEFPWMLALTHPSAALRRSAAELLGRTGSAPAEEVLRCFDQAITDPVLRHSLLYSLIEIGNKDRLRRELRSVEHTGATVAALQAYYQLPVETQDDTLAYQFLGSANQDVQNMAADIVSKHLEWAGRDAASGMIDSLITAESMAPVRSQVLSAWRDASRVQQAIAEAIEIADSSAQTVELLKPWRGRGLPPVLDQVVAKVFAREPTPLIPLVASIRLQDKSNARMLDVVTQILQSAGTSKGRLSIDMVTPLLHSLPRKQKIENPALVDRLIDQRRFELLPKLQMSLEEGEALLHLGDSLSIQDIGIWCAAIASTGMDRLDAEMLNALRTIRPAKTIRPSFLRNLYSKRSSALQKLAEEVIEQLQQVGQEVQEGVAERLAGLPAGDALRGMQVFRSTKTACASCHRVGYHGGTIGPELTRIGATRTEEALLEAVLFPNARIEQSYRATRILTDEDQVLIGIPKELGNEVQLQLDAQHMVTVSTDEIVEMKPSEVSIMPTGLGTQLSDQQLADLLAFLKSAR